MLRSPLMSFYRRLGIRSLEMKVLVPSAALFLLSLIGGAILFLGGSHLARRRQVEEQNRTEAEHVIEAMGQRVEAVSSAAQMLAEDPSMVEAIHKGSDTSRRMLDSHAWDVRERFDLALVQIYDSQGEVQAGLVLSSIDLDNSVSLSLLNMAESNKSVGRAVDGHVLLLNRAPSNKLCTPLNTITGVSRSLLEDDVLLSEQQERGLGLIHSLGRYLLELTDDFLDVSRMRASAITLSLEEVDMRLLIESALDAVAPLIDGKPITLQADIDADLPAVRADKRRIRQVMLNLLSSAATFTESGQISVRARMIEALNADGERVEPFVEVRISDTALEISKDRLRDGFRALSPSDSSPNAECIATGFALPITKVLVDLHVGRIWADGAFGKRATFTFVLPVDHLKSANENLPGRRPGKPGDSSG